MEKTKKYNADLLEYARNLRKNQTPEERHLWYDFLCRYPVKFNRQKILGHYILDFYCAKAAIAIELDGSQHYKEDARKYDSERTAFLNEYGIEVIRFLNRDITDNFENVCKYIDIQVTKRLEEFDQD